MTNTEPRTKPTFIEGSAHDMPVSQVAGLYDLPADTQQAIIIADYRDVYDRREDMRNIERGPVELTDLPSTAQTLRRRGFHNLRFRPA